MPKKYITKDSGDRVKFASGMNRDIQDGKARYDLIYLPLLTRWAELMGRGAEKYGERNWEKADSLEELARFKASAFRHFIQIMENDTTEDHYAAVCFNLAAIIMVEDKLNKK